MNLNNPGKKKKKKSNGNIFQSHVQFLECNLHLNTRTAGTLEEEYDHMVAYYKTHFVYGYTSLF